MTISCHHIMSCHNAGEEKKEMNQIGIKKNEVTYISCQFISKHFFETQIFKSKMEGSHPKKKKKKRKGCWGQLSQPCCLNERERERATHPLSSHINTTKANPCAPCISQRVSHLMKIDQILLNMIASKISVLTQSSTSNRQLSSSTHSLTHSFTRPSLNQDLAKGEQIHDKSKKGMKSNTICFS